MKKILAFVLCIALMLALVACGSAPTPAAAPAAEAPAAEAPAAEAPAAAAPAAEAPAAEAPAAEAPAASAPTEKTLLTEQTFTAAELEGKVKLLGRAYFDESGLRCDWPASGIEFTVECGGDMRINGTSAATTYRYSVYIDGVEYDRQFALSDGKEKIAFKNVPEGQHTIRIVRDSDGYPDKPTVFTSVTLTCNPSSLEATAQKDLFLEFVGDSITSGGGALGDHSSAWSSSINAATKTYAYVCADLLDADYSMVSKGGIGALKASGSVYSQDLYRCKNPLNPEDGEYVSDRHPDVVIIELGPNDPKSDPDTAFHDAMVAYGKQIREKHPDAKLVYAYGFMSLKHDTTFLQIAETLGGEAAGVYTCQVQTLTNGTPAKEGGTGHPSVADHLVNGNLLAEFLKNNVLK